jgi:hypothetical protein
MDHGELREEFGVDAPFVERRRDRPAPSFRVGRDVYAGYFVVLRPSDGDKQPFWIPNGTLNVWCVVYAIELAERGMTNKILYFPILGHVIFVP